MAHNLCIFYDDRYRANDDVAGIVGARRYGDILYHKEHLFSRAQEVAAKAGAAIHRILRDEDFAHHARLNYGTVVYHRASAAVSDAQAYGHLLAKVAHAEESLADQRAHPQFAVFASQAAWESFLSQLMEGETVPAVEAEMLAISHALTDISALSSLLSLLSGMFETRHFNSVTGDDHILIKSSGDIAKIRREYRYHYLLPEALRYWFVPPFDYHEEAKGASYRMERIHLPNVAVSWVHGAFSTEEFAGFLNQAFRFLQERPTQAVKGRPAVAGAEALYFDKVQVRFAELRAHPLFARLDALVRSGLEEGGIEALMKRYVALARHVLGAQPEPLAISHGDFCFSNLLYDKHTGQLRLIDPKGADREEELWMDRYYDVAKLSHSILGNYDFACQGLFTLSMEDDLRFSLLLASHTLEPLKQLFVERLRLAGYDPLRVRLCELSLFLSLLPLHTDDPKRMLAFLITAHTLLEELEANA